MFKKASCVTFKGESKLRGKEAKKLREAVATRFAGGEAASTSLLPPKADIVVRKAGGGSSILFVFIENECVLWQTDGRADIGDAELIPTLQAFWRVGAATLLPCVLLQRPVAKYVFGGANVMAPGVHSIQDKSGRLSVGDLVAVRCVGNPSACAVGRLRMSPASLATRGVKGEAIEVLHYFGDALWESVGRPRPAGFVGDRVEATEAECDGASSAEDSDSADDGEGRKVQQKGSAAPAQAAFSPPSRVPKQDSGTDAGENHGSASADDPGSLVTTGADDQKVTPEAMTKILEESFLQAAKTRIKDKDLPLTGNALYAQHMRPCRRAGSHVDVKTSSCKKLVTFLSRLEDLGWIALKKHSAEPIVTKIVRDHTDLQDWKPWPRSETAEFAEAASGGNSGSTAGRKDAPVATIEVEVVWRVDKKLAPLLEAVGQQATEDGCWTRSDCQDALKRYADKRELWMKNNRKRIEVDDILLAIIPDQAATGSSGGALGFSLDALVDRVLGKMSMCHRVAAPQKGAVGGMKRSVRQGKPPTVQVRTDIRRGHNVTLVHGIESYGVDEEAFAACLQKALASSATVEEASGSVQAAVMVQGFWDVAVVEWLSKIGIPEASIEHQVKKGQGQKKAKVASNIVKH